MSDQTSERQMPAFLPLLALLGSFALLLFVLLPQPAARPAPSPTATALPPATVPAAPTTEPVIEVAIAYSPEQIAQGQTIYQSTCTACHGLDARGIPGLGKNLVDSEFIHSLSDDELHHFIIVGREASDPLNTTGIPMPARGGNPTLTDDQINAIIAYLRSLSAPAPTVQTTPAVVAAAPSPTVAAPQNPPVLPTSIPVTPQPFTAETAYNWSCAGCHGADGSGSEPFGPGFLESPLLADKAALLSFLTTSQPPVDPAIRFPHPVRGGYPELTDEQLSALVDYVYGFTGQ
jgi:mono/diheme cytochrome c family protein